MKRINPSLLALVALSAACAAPGKATLADVQPPVAWVDTLPVGAVVSVNGVEVGAGPLSFPVPDEARAYAVRVSAPGFEPLELSVGGARLAGARLDLVLRPQGFGTQRQLQAGEPAGLLQAAAALLRADRPRDALAYAKASVAAGDTPEAHRVLGDAWRRLGNRDLAVKEWSLYVTLAPDAPDRRQVEKAISAAAGDIDVTPAGERRN